MKKIKVTLSLDAPAIATLNRLASERTRGVLVSSLLLAAEQRPALTEGQQEAIREIRSLLDKLERKPLDDQPIADVYRGK